MKKLCLSPEQQQGIVRHCLDSYPLEACGLLIGRQDVTGEGLVTGVIPSPNMSDHPENSFEIDPALILHHHKEGRLTGEKILGHYHSHPNGRAEPSAQDQKQNYDKELIWLIIAVTEAGCQDIKAFAMADESGKLQPIQIDLLAH